jgi:hypothetical protein
MLGFILTRHVNSEETNLLWIEAYNSIRHIYPLNMIMIIDDNSNQSFIKIPADLNLLNTFIIQSEFPQRGEILAYYYFNKYQLFDTAVIIHDSVFIKEPIDFSNIEDIQFLWHFYHDWDDEANEKKIIKTLQDTNTLLNFYDNKDKWVGCFGCQSVISRAFLEKLISNYKIFDLFSIVNTRQNRMAFERIFALICTFEKPELCDSPSIFGNIISYCKWGSTYKDYKKSEKNTLPLVKVWSGR